MRFQSAQLTHFRNIEKASLEFSSDFTALVGPNGQGKTNTIEALYLISALRPLRSVPRRALVQHEKKTAELSLNLQREDTGLTHALGFHIGAQGRTLFKDGKRTDTASFLGVSVAVAFTPDDLQLGKGGPDGRRRFLDRAILNGQPGYLSRALRYMRAIRERNRALAEGASDDVLDAFDPIVASEGAAISVARANYVAELEPVLQQRFDAIAAPAPKLSARYNSALKEGLQRDSVEKTTKAFGELLHRKRAYDKRRKSTSIGPHIDDLVLSFNGVSIKERASQGQHRALVLALKLAELTHLAQRLGEAPVLLLDDMSSELDMERSRQLFQAIRALDGQVILTTTQEPDQLLPSSSKKRELIVYDVKEGRLEKR